MCYRIWDFGDFRKVMLNIVGILINTSSREFHNTHNNTYLYNSVYIIHSIQGILIFWQRACVFVLNGLNTFCKLLVSSAQILSANELGHVTF